MTWCGMPSSSCSMGATMRASTSARRHARGLEDDLDLGGRDVGKGVDGQPPQRQPARAARPSDSTATSRRCARQRQSGGGIYFALAAQAQPGALERAVPEMATIARLQAAAHCCGAAACGPSPRRWAKSPGCCARTHRPCRLAHHRLGGHAQVPASPWRAPRHRGLTNCCSRRPPRGGEVGAQQLHRLVGAIDLWRDGCQPRWVAIRRCLRVSPTRAGRPARAQPAAPAPAGRCARSWPGMPASSRCPGRADSSSTVPAAGRAQRQLRLQHAAGQAQRPQRLTAFRRASCASPAGGAAVPARRPGMMPSAYSCSSRASLLAASACDWACSSSRCQTSSSGCKACHDLAGPDALAGRHQHLLHHARQRAAQQFVAWGGSSTWPCSTRPAPPGWRRHRADARARRQPRSGQLSRRWRAGTSAACAGAASSAVVGEQVGQAQGSWAVGARGGMALLFSARSRERLKSSLGNR
jgi:hypothetical protein